MHHVAKEQAIAAWWTASNGLGRASDLDLLTWQPTTFRGER
jgi:hypothetical protein